MGRIQGKVAVITGAASGMGRATALRFAKEGASVVLTDLNAHGGETAVAECAAAGGRAVFQRTDVTSEPDIKAAVARAVKEFGRLDIMFNNAGVAGAVGPIEKVSAADWDKTIAILLRAAFLGMKYSIPEMRKAGGGSIISTASVAGLRGVVGLHAYCAAKAAVVNLTRSAALEFAKDRIRVNCICPGVINTPILHRNVPGVKEALEQWMVKGQPIPRAGHPEDIAGMALYLASDDSVFVTGQAMIVDGGLTVGSQFSAAGGESMPSAIQPAGFLGPSFQG